jgi:plasmid stability protein
MATMIQIRNVPDTLHRRLKSHAALAGTSLSDYLLGEIHQILDRGVVNFVIP